MATSTIKFDKVSALPAVSPTGRRGSYVSCVVGDRDPVKVRTGSSNNGRWSRRNMLIISSAITVAVFSMDSIMQDWTCPGFEFIFYTCGVVFAVCYKAFASKAKPMLSGKGSRNGGKEHTPAKLSVDCCDGNVSPASSCATRSPLSPSAAKAQADGNSHDVADQCRSIRSHAKRGNVKSARDLFEQLQRKCMQPDEDCYAAIMSAYVKAEDPIGAEAWMERIEDLWSERSLPVYAMLIQLFTRLGDTTRATKWFRRMVDFGLLPDSNLYNLMIQACSLKGDTASAREWLKEMADVGGHKASVMTYTTLIGNCAKTSDVEGAEEWMQEMQRLDIEPNVVSYSTMMNACAKLGDAARAEKWYFVMKERGVEPNAYIYSALINACAQANDLDGACAWLDRAERAGTAVDSVVYGCVINACSKKGDAERGMVVFQKMRAQGIESHIIVYGSLARPYAYRGDWQEVERIRDEMGKDGIKMNDYFLYSLLLAYSRAKPRQAVRAEREFCDAMEAGIVVNRNIVKALCQAVGRGAAHQILDKFCSDRDEDIRVNEPKSERKRQKRLDQRLHLQWCDEAHETYKRAKAKGLSEEEAKKQAQQVNLVHTVATTSD